MTLGLREQRYAFAASLTFFATLMGPFGTYDDLGGAARFWYWSFAIVSAGIFVNFALKQVFANQLMSGISSVFRAILGGAIGALPTTVVVVILETQLRATAIDAKLVLTIWFSVTAIGSVVGFHRYRPLPKEPNNPTELNVLTEYDAPFFDRLPNSLGRELISLSIDDHYLRVTTNLGSEMILTTLSNAIKELDDYPGMRVHRSHWVSIKAVQKLTTVQGRHYVLLSDERELPVSRSYLAQVRKRL